MGGIQKPPKVEDISGAAQFLFFHDISASHFTSAWPSPCDQTVACAYSQFQLPQNAGLQIVIMAFLHLHTSLARSTNG